MNKFQKLKKGSIEFAVDDLHSKVVKGDHSQTDIEKSANEKTSVAVQPKVKETAITEKRATKRTQKANTPKKVRSEESPVKNKPSREGQVDITVWIDRIIGEHRDDPKEVILHELFEDIETNSVAEKTTVRYPEFLLRLLRNNSQHHKMTMAEVIQIIDKLGPDLDMSFDKQQVASIQTELLERIKYGKAKHVNVSKTERDKLGNYSSKKLFKYQVILCAKILSEVRNGKDIIEQCLPSS